MYCTYQDIENKIGYQRLGVLSSDSGTSPNPDIVENAITISTAIIDGYLRSKYKLPLQNNHIVLQNIAVELTVFELTKRRGNTQLKEKDETIYKDCINQLKDLQKGIIMLNEADENRRETAFAVFSNKPLFDESLKKFRNLI